MKASCSTVSSKVVSDTSDDSVTEDCSASDEEDSSAAVSIDVGEQRAGTSLLIPADLLRRPNLVSLATRLKMTPA